MSKPERDSRITVMLVDDHSAGAARLPRMLEDDPGIVVVAEASDGQEAVDVALRERPACNRDGLRNAQHEWRNSHAPDSRAAPGTAILMLSMHAEPTYVRNCLDAGARGYILKNAMDLELVAAVNRSRRAKPYSIPRLAFSASETESTVRRLSPRELEVLQLIVNGKSNKDIAAILNLSVNTVAVHRANIMQALDIHNTAELVVYAIRHG